MYLKYLLLVYILVQQIILNNLSWECSRVQSSFLSQTGSLRLGTIDILAGVIPCCRRGCPVLCRIFPTSLDSTHHMLVAPFPHDNQNYLQTLPNIRWGTKTPPTLPVENRWSKILLLLICSNIITDFYITIPGKI